MVMSSPYSLSTERPGCANSQRNNWMISNPKRVLEKHKHSLRLKEKRVRSCRAKISSTASSSSASPENASSVMMTDQVHAVKMAACSLTELPTLHYLNSWHQLFSCQSRNAEIAVHIQTRSWGANDVNVGKYAPGVQEREWEGRWVTVKKKAAECFSVCSGETDKGCKV